MAINAWGMMLVTSLVWLIRRHHVSALADLWQRAKAPIAMHEADLSWTFGEHNHWQPYFQVPRRPDAIQRLLKGGEKFDDAGLVYSVIATPGHSPGGVCFSHPLRSPGP